MQDKSSKVCREIVNTKTVLQDKTTETLLTSLVSEGKINRADCKKVSNLLKKDLEVQMGLLVDRVLRTLAPETK